MIDFITFYHAKITWLSLGTLLEIVEIAFSSALQQFVFSNMHCCFLCVDNTWLTEKLSQQNLLFSGGRKKSFKPEKNS